jgi:uracil-DNA glycosylase
MVDLTLTRLHTQIRACTACPARPEAASPVPGIGNKTGILFMGRNPGRTEDIEGKPFTGPSGRILDQFLAMCGLTRSDIYLTNTILCHTYKDREPTSQELKTCLGLHFKPLLELIHPYLVVTMGNGTVIKHKAGFYMIPTYHPGAVLYDSSSRSNLVYSATQIRRFLAHRETLLKEIGWHQRR